jgi:hypothetical protein
MDVVLTWDARLGCPCGAKLHLADELRSWDDGRRRLSPRAANQQCHP